MLRQVAEHRKHCPGNRGAQARQRGCRKPWCQKVQGGHTTKPRRPAAAIAAVDRLGSKIHHSCAVSAMQSVDPCACWVKAPTSAADCGGERQKACTHLLVGALRGHLVEGCLGQHTPFPGRQGMRLGSSAQKRAHQKQSVQSPAEMSVWAGRDTLVTRLSRAQQNDAAAGKAATTC